MREDDLFRWDFRNNKSLSLLWLRSKNAQLMDLAMRLKPEDYQDEEAMNDFLDAVSVYGAIDACIDMVEQTQHIIYSAQAENAKLKKTIYDLNERIKMFEGQLDELDEYLR